jgi:hypothetical protein
LQGFAQLGVQLLELGIDALQGEDPLDCKDTAEGVDGGRLLVLGRHRTRPTFVSDVVHPVPERFDRVLELEQVTPHKRLAALAGLAASAEPFLDGDRAYRADEMRR